MGNVGQARCGASEVDRARKAAVARVGRLPVEGRYHRLPRRLEDDYELGKVLGTGVSGAVVLARSRRTGTRYAVKSFNTVRLNDQQREMLASEVGIYLSMDHPHVARLMAVYESERDNSLVMEYLEGGELCDRVEAQKVLTEGEAAHATWQMLLAINYLHSEGVVHRDLKLENFLFEQKGGNFLKLIDFGFSNFYQEATAMRESCGTIFYIAPEVLERSYVGGSCDMWSLGVIVFVLLAGYMPFAGKLDGDIIRAIRHGRFTMHMDRWAHISEAAQDFVKRLLVKKPGDRMTAKEAMRHPWLAKHSGIGLQVPDSVDSGASTLVASDVAGAFLSFARATRFQQACMRMMAWILPAEERRLLRDTFLEMDTSHMGVINFPQLDRLLEESCQMSKLDHEAVWKAMEMLDVDNDGELHYSDFLAAMMAPRLKQIDCNAVKETFQRFDVEGLGYLTEEGLWWTLGEEVSRPELRCTFRLVANDGDGKIYLEDFVAHLREDLGVSHAQLAPSSGSTFCFARRYANHSARTHTSHHSHGGA